MIICLLPTILVTFISSNIHAEEFEYLKPGEVEGIPQKHIATLISEGCSIPKWHYKFGGIAEGEFAKNGQTDLAVICKNDTGGFIRIFWGGEASCPNKIESWGQFIDTVGKEYIVSHYEGYGGTKPPEISHQAINDYYVEKSSIVNYCHNGKWLKLTGAD